jgi:hypothetical protein
MWLPIGSCGFIYSEAYKESLNHTALQVGRLQVSTTIRAAHIAACDMQVSPVTTPAASLPIRRLCSRTENVNLQPSLVLVYELRRDRG